MAAIKFDLEEQHFRLETEELVIPRLPLTVTLQITRQCNLNCIYCSESERIPDPSLDMIKQMLMNLKGVNRVIVSGGEPTLRQDLLSILRMCREDFDTVVLASNATRIDLELAMELANYLDYVDVTVDGPRNVHNKIRGSYDETMNGLWNLKQSGVEFSIVTVLLDENRNCVPYIAQVADVLGAKKLKILTPIPKGRGKNVMSRVPSSSEIEALFSDLKHKKETMGWNLRIVLTNWQKIREGHALLVHPNGDVVASPVWSRESCTLHVGNALEESIETIWQRYPYKENHVKKYLERSLRVC